MVETAIVVDPFTVAALIGTSVIFLTGAGTAWFFHRALRRSEERLTERLARQIHEELAGLKQLQPDCATTQVEDDLSEHVLELTELVDDDFPKHGEELRNPTAKEGGTPSMAQILSSMERIIRTEKEKQRSEEQLTERPAQQINEELPELEQSSRECATKQVGDDLSEQTLELADEDPSTEKILSAMRRVISA